MKHVGSIEFRARYGPWALVAGASVGLGAEYATQLAAKGLNLVLVARRKEPMDELAAKLVREYAIEVRTLQLDLARDDIGSVLTAETAGLEIGLLVYNAAVSIIGSFLKHPLEDHLSELAVNCRAPLTLAYLFGQRMLERRRGGIILMSSLSSSQGSALIANYGATKAYNRILAEGLWEELRMQGIDVLTCSAGALSTPNYIESLSDRPGRSTGMAMAVGQVVSETLAALGKRPVVIPGWGNRFANIVMQRLLPHQVAIRLMGRVLRGMYAQK